MLLLSSGAQFFCENNWFARTNTELLAERVVARKMAADISDSELRVALEAVRKKAGDGDVDATAFLFEVAQRQRRSTEPAGG